MHCFYVYLALIWKKTAHHCGLDDTEEHMQHTVIWRDKEETVDKGIVGSLWDSHRAPGRAFKGLERHGGKWLITKFSFWGGVSL